MGLIPTSGLLTPLRLDVRIPDTRATFLDRSRRSLLSREILCPEYKVVVHVRSDLGENLKARELKDFFLPAGNAHDINPVIPFLAKNSELSSTESDETHLLEPPFGVLEL